MHNLLDKSFIAEIETYEDLYNLVEAVIGVHGSDRSTTTFSVLAEMIVHLLQENRELKARVEKLEKDVLSDRYR